MFVVLKHIQLTKSANLSQRKGCNHENQWVKIFLQPYTRVSIFLLHFIAKIKLMLYFYFQIPSEINQPWHTSAIQQKASPAEWDQNKATMNRKKTLNHSEQPLRKNRFCPSIQDWKQNDNTIPQCRSHNKF